MTSTTTDIGPTFPFVVGDTIFERYRVEEIQGSVGSVWYLKASYVMAPQLGYAIQVLPSSGKERCALRDYFLEEARRVADIPCPPFVSVVRSAALEHGHAVIVREYLPGKHILHEMPMRPLSPVRAMRVVESIASAMATAHERGLGMHGFSHYDVMLNVSSGDDTVRTFMLQSPHRLGAICHDEVRVRGKMSRYHAPEFVHTGAASIGADVYSVAMLCVVLLFGAANEEFLDDREGFDFGHLESFRPVVLRGLSADPTERFPCVESFLLAARQSAWSAQASAVDTRGRTPASRVFARRIEKR